MNIDFRNYMVLTSECGQGIMGWTNGNKGLCYYDRETEAVH